MFSTSKCYLYFTGNDNLIPENIADSSRDILTADDEMIELIDAGQLIGKKNKKLVDYMHNNCLTSTDENSASNSSEVASDEQSRDDVHHNRFTVFPGDRPKSGKRPIPAVATSESWEEYYQKQDQVKRMAELAKRRKLEERQEKAKAKQEEKAAKALIAKEKAELKKKEKEKKMAEKEARMRKTQEQKQKRDKKMR